MLTSTRSSAKTSRGGRRGVAEQPIGVHERQVADEDGGPVAEAPWLAVPAAFGVPGGELDVDAGLAVPPGRTVHDVVVDEGEAVQQLEGGAGVDHPGHRRDRRRPRPTPSGRTPAGAACRRRRGRGARRWARPGRVDGRPPLLLGGEQGVDPCADPTADRGQRGRRIDGRDRHAARVRPRVPCSLSAGRRSPFSVRWRGRASPTCGARRATPAGQAGAGGQEVEVVVVEDGRLDGLVPSAPRHLVGDRGVEVPGAGRPSRVTATVTARRRPRPSPADRAHTGS